jgi:hypothetical protein
MTLSDTYCRHLDTVNRAGLFQRIGAAQQLLAREDDVERRNRGLYDAFQLLEGTWEDRDETRQWSFVNLQELRGRTLPEEVDETLRRMVVEQIDKAAADTPESFHELQKHRPACFENDEDYRQWFYKFAPYLTLDLPEPLAKGLKEASDRLTWFTELAVDEGIRAHIWSVGWGRILDWRETRVQ